MLLRSALILLAFLVVMGACTSEEVTPDSLAEPTVEGEVAPEQSATRTGQAMQENTIGPRPGDKVIDLCSPPQPSYITDESPRIV